MVVAVKSFKILMALTGLYWHECQEGGEDVETYEKTCRWLQLLNDFKCVETSTWASCHDQGEFHTRRGWWRM